MTEDEYREKAKLEIATIERQIAAAARGEIVHGWSIKAEKPCWSDDKIVGAVVRND